MLFWLLEAILQDVKGFDSRKEKHAEYMQVKTQDSSYPNAQLALRAPWHLACKGRIRDLASSLGEARSNSAQLLRARKCN